MLVVCEVTVLLALLHYFFKNSLRSIIMQLTVHYEPHEVLSERRSREPCHERTLLDFAR